MLTRKEEIINELKKKVKHLITLYTSSLNRIRDLYEENEAIKIKLELIKNENKELKDKIKTLKTAKGISNEEYTVEAKHQISRLVREIDKCIALLNN